jgi:hypothetical protein
VSLSKHASKLGLGQKSRFVYRVYVYSIQIYDLRESIWLGADDVVYLLAACLIPVTVSYLVLINLIA